jgi:multisubunit Na+/H+ antiporter MnhE subunit
MVNMSHLVWGAIVGAIVVPVTGSIYTSLTASGTPSLTANYTWGAVVSGAITGVAVVLVLDLLGKGA